MTALVLLFVCLALGIAVAHVARPPTGLAQALNWWVINIALPALVLNVIPGIHFEAQFWFLTAANWLVFIGSWLLFAALGKAFGWSRAHWCAHAGRRSGQHGIHGLPDDRGAARRTGAVAGRDRRSDRLLSVVLQAGMPPMVSAAILADQYGLEPALANAVLGLAILLCLASVPWLNTLL